MGNDVVRQLRTLLILGRVSNLPTVWSNCLAGWWLGGGGNAARLPFLFAGVSFLYTGGMFLNDAFDAEFDRNFRKERPVPSGAITIKAVWHWSLMWFAAGTISLFFSGMTPGVLGLVLALCIVAYDAAHKLITFSPILMGLCRFFVYATAAATGVNGVSGWAIWSGLALGTYIVGLSCLARKESTRGPVHRRLIFPLVAPILLTLLIDDGSHLKPALLRSLLLALWTSWCLRTTFRANNINIRRTVSGLLSGVVLVDWLSATHLTAPQGLSSILFALFALTLILQRLIPAT